MSRRLMLSSMSGDHRMTLTTEERAVILAMRQDETAGDAIFGYSMNVSEETFVNVDAHPYHRD
jgi:hypothetical protein